MEKQHVKLSVIVPLYNKEDSITRTIESILTQSFTDFELIIVNDGSTDRSAQIVAKIPDERIRVIHQTNQGVSAARNRGANEAKGEWLLFLDADDFLYPEGLANLFLLRENIPGAAIYSGNFITYYDEQHERQACSLDSSGYIDDPFKYRWFKMWNMRLGCFIMKRECFSAIKGFDLFMTKGEDIFFTDSLQKNYPIVYTPRLIMKYDREKSNLSKKRFPIEKNITWYLRPTDQNRYKRLIDAEIIGKDIVRNVLKPDINAIKLLHKNWKYSFTIVFAGIYRAALTILPKKVRS